MTKHRKKKKRVLSGRFVWLILLLIMISFALVMMNLKMIPDQWKWIVFFALAAAGAVTGILSTVFYKNRLIKAVDILLCLALAAGAVLIPHYERKVSSLFDSLSGNKTTVRLYIMNEAYRQEYPEYFADNTVSDRLEDYESAVFITTMTTDYENQNYALEELKKEFGSDVKTVNCINAVEAAEYLYTNQGEVLILSDAFVSMITETEGYEDFEEKTDILASYSRVIENLIQQTDTTLTEEPFAIFFGGNDEEGELYLQCRTDVDMIVTVNPNTHQIAIISYPRDSYIPNPSYGSSAYDKLTHLGISGIQNTLDGLNSYMNLDGLIRNYVIINFTTYRNIIDALDGVDVDNDISFTADDGRYFPAGPIHLEGDAALMYVRERHAFADGDFERNLHQQLVMKAIVAKISSPEVITRFDDLLTALKGTFLTNLSSDSIYALCKKQLSENISWNIVNYHVIGETGFGQCASSGGESLSVVYPYDNQVEFVSQVIQDVYAGRILEQESIPEGMYNDSSSSYAYGY